MSVAAAQAPSTTAGRAAQDIVHVVLYAPDIPQNTGNIGRTCAFANARLHLVHPLGFRIDDKHLRRAGMDYWRQLDVHEHADWAGFCQSPLSPKRLWLMTTHTTRSFWDASYAPGDGLVFGKETSGAPPWLHDAVAAERRICIDRLGAPCRSLNLASSAAIALYEVQRQLRLATPAH